MVSLPPCSVQIEHDLIQEIFKDWCHITILTTTCMLIFAIKEKRSMTYSTKFKLFLYKTSATIRGSPWHHSESYLFKKYSFPGKWFTGNVKGLLQRTTELVKHWLQLYCPYILKNPTQTNQNPTKPTAYHNLPNFLRFLPWLPIQSHLL